MLTRRRGGHNKDWEAGSDEEAGVAIAEGYGWGEEEEEIA